MLSLIAEAIYETRGRREVGCVRAKLITGDKRFNILVEYSPANPNTTYAEPQFELVDWRGYVFGANTPHDRDLTQFVEYNEETYYQ